jgi:Cys-tRNA(Pro) deacylase
MARLMGVKRVSPCTPETAHRHTGYLVGGISPFGVRKSMPIYMEGSILTLPRIYINGGRRGFLVGLDPRELVRVLNPTMVSAGI